jgi:hypothetical protein
MKREMYEILNRAEIDFNEYEEIPLSKEEKAVVKTRIQKEIRKTGRNYHNGRNQYDDSKIFYFTGWSAFRDFC